MVGKTVQFGAWFLSARRRSPLVQRQIASRVGASLGQRRTQEWVSRVQTGKAFPSSIEAALLAAVVGADPVEALTVAGYLEEPPLMLLDRKLDTLIQLQQAVRV